MCGIAGIVGSQDTSVLDAMTRSLAHRGPDGEGIVRPAGEGFGLGVRRLAVIDLSSAGAQPMSDPTGRFIIAYNGEVYNFREIRADLAARGRTFRSHTDTEVVLAAFEAWGTECLKRLNGMFAFAIWDRTTRTLFAARDRIGIKPFYWARIGSVLLFASEIKSILASGLVKAESDPDVAHNPWHYPAAPRTGFRGIEKLPHGHFLAWEGGAISIRRWWAVEPREDDPGDGPAVDELASLLEDSVRLQMVGDVPVGAMLSGGVDSSTIAALMRKSTFGSMHTFSIAFRDTDKRLEASGEDSRFARLMARRLGCEHHELEVAPDIVDLLPRLVWQLDEPVADPAAINTFLIAEAARKEGVVVLLSGMGADEIFGGYRKYLACVLAERYQWLLPLGVRTAIEKITGQVPVASTHAGFRRLRWAKRFLGFASLGPVQRFLRSDLSLSPRDYARVFSDAALHPYEELAEVHSREASMGHRDLPYLTRMCLSDTEVYLPDHNLTYTDKATMAAGVEARPALVDHRIVELAFRLADRYRIRGMEQKWLLRQAASRWLPRDVVRRPKSPFSAPLRAWIRRDLREMVDDLLAPAALRGRGLYRPEGVRALIDEDREGQNDHSQFIWTLLWREVWFRTFIDARPDMAAAAHPYDLASVRSITSRASLETHVTGGTGAFRSIPLPKRRLLAIVQLPPPVHGVSVMNQAVVTSQGLQSAFDVEVLPLRFATSVADVGRLSARKVVRSVAVTARLLKHCLRARPDLAYFTLVPVGLAFYRDLAFVSVLKAFDVPVVYHLHGKGVRRASRSPLQRSLYRWVFRRETVVHLSSHLYADIADYVAPERCIILPNGIPDSDPDSLLKRAERQPGPVHILFLSNMRVTKGPLVLLEALGMLRRKGVPFRASFAGAWSEVECTRKFNALIRNLDLEETVAYRGPVYGEQKKETLASADVFVFPTFYPAESLPLVILEAMSFALPVVATPEGGIPDMVEDGVTGLLVPQRNAEALALGLERLILDPPLRKAMGMRGRERFLQRFTLDRFESDLRGIFEQAFAARVTPITRRSGAKEPSH